MHLVDEILQSPKKKKDRNLTLNQIRTLKEYDDWNRITKGCKLKTRQMELQKFMHFLEKAGKDFNDINIEDVRNFLSNKKKSETTGREISQSTIESWKTYLKKFFRKRPDIIEDEFLAKSNHKYQFKKPSEMLTEEEVLHLIKSLGDNIQHKALISLLWDAGPREGELVKLNISDVVERGNRWYITFEGKTGIRQVEIVTSAHWLKEWINVHPWLKDNRLKEESEIPLFVSFANQRYLERITEGGIWEIIRGIKLKTGIKKHLTPHIFRHSSATFWGQYLTESEMRKRYGWSPTSAMPSFYIHLSQKQVNDKVHAIATGKKPEEIQEPSKLLGTPCPKCGEINSPDREWCLNPQCGLPLIPEKQKKARRERMIMEAFTSPYAARSLGIDVDKIAEDYNYLRDYLVEVLQFKEAFKGQKLMTLYQLRENLEWNKQKFNEFIDWIRESPYFQFDNDTLTILEFKDPLTGEMTDFFSSFEFLYKTLIQGRKSDKK